MYGEQLGITDDLGDTAFKSGQLIDATKNLGDNSTTGPDGKPISKKQAEKLKKQAERELAAARAKEAAKPKSSKTLEIEEKVKAQGDAVRKLKAEKGAPEAIQEAVAALQKLKLDLKASEDEDQAA